MKQNIVFFPASVELRQQLHKLGLDFVSVTIESSQWFMVVTNQIRLAKEIARQHKIHTFYISDNQRQVFKVIFSTHGSYDYFPVRLGQLSKDSEKTGKPFLVVTEDNATYHYSITPIL